MVKTNAMRLLTAAGVGFRTAEYPWDESDLSGVHAAAALGMAPETVFKTLVARGDRTGPLVFCIPVAETLDPRKAALASGSRRVELVPLKELLGLTGYLRGGCSPIGMKKRFPTCIDETAQLFDEIAVSAGMRGEQLILSPGDLAAFVEASFADLTV